MTATANHGRFPRVAAWGTGLWLAASAASVHGLIPLTAIEQLFLLSPFVVVPLGFGFLSDGSEFDAIPPWASWAVLIGGVASLAAFGIPRGLLSGALALPWALVTIGAACLAVRRVFQRGVGSLAQICFAAACFYLPIGGLWFVVSRLGMARMGFEEPIVLLTAVHFHNTGFAATVLVAAAAEKFQGPRERAAMRAIAAGVMATPALIAAGFVFSPHLKLAAALGLAISLIGLSLLTFVRLRSVTPASAGVLLGISAGSVVAGMVLSSIYATGDFAAREWISIPAMAVTHGVLNGVGFVLCGLLGWTLARSGSSEPRDSVRGNKTRKEARLCASRLPVGRDLSAVIWRDGWSN